MTANYQNDFYSWTVEQAEAMRSGRYADLDIQNLIEEIESMGRSEKRALESLLTVLCLHMLKWHYQPTMRGKSWQCSIDVQRKRFQKLLRENPGLKPLLLNDVYEQAYEAFQETGIDIEVFPKQCPWTYEQIADANFYPD